MTFVVYLVIMLSATPAPTFMILDGFDNMADCQQRIISYAKKSELSDTQVAKLACMPLITSPLTTPL